MHFFTMTSPWTVLNLLDQTSQRQNLYLNLSQTSGASLNNNNKCIKHNLQHLQINFYFQRLKMIKLNYLIHDQGVELGTH